MKKELFINKYGNGIERADINIGRYSSGVGYIIITPNYPGSRYDGSRVVRWYIGCKRTPEQVLRRCNFDPSIMELLNDYKEVNFSLNRETDEIRITTY